MVLAGLVLEPGDDGTLLFAAISISTFHSPTRLSCGSWL